LLARADPYHFKDDSEWDSWLWDASLYNGHYYIYWGPVPGLCLFLVKLLTTYTHTIHDQWLVLFFMLMRLYAGAALILRYAQTQYPELSAWVVQLAILVFGLASPTPYFLARPLVYEASIAAGQGFLFLGLYCAYRGLLSALMQSRWFVAAGACFACAMGSRGSLLIATPLVIAATVFCAQRPAGYPLRGLLRSSVALGAPYAAGIGLYALYNQLRFDSFSEFGLTYQLTGRAFSNENRYFLPNLISYLTSEIRWSCAFPYARLPRTRNLTSLIDWPEDYEVGGHWNSETTAGVLVGTTICWFWGVWLYRAALGLKRAYPGFRSATPAPEIAPATRELWLLLSSIAAICALAPASRMWMANMRFLQDAAGGIVLGAIAAAFWLLRKPHEPARPDHKRRRRLFLALYAVLALHTSFVGVCLGFTGHTDSFPSENKRLFKQLQKKLSVCRWQRELRKVRP
jgi:hypothetical protein